ncbi:MAG: hypothetical protein AAGA77_17765, partial [Bacteroidota bacterium]
SFGKRIKQYIDYKGLNIRSFELKSTLKNGAIHRVVKNDTSLNGESITALGETWEDLNLNWLMTGTGEMLMDPPPIVADPPHDYKKVRKLTEELKWHKDSLIRADEHIALQKEMIEALKLIIEHQKTAAKKAGIDL